MADIRIGTSGFTAAGWSGTFYPKSLKPADYLSYYAQHFDTVELDSNFYDDHRFQHSCHSGNRGRIPVPGSKISLVNKKQKR